MKTKIRSIQGSIMTNIHFLFIYSIVDVKLTFAIIIIDKKTFTAFENVLPYLKLYGLKFSKGYKVTCCRRKAKISTRLQLGFNSSIK